MSAKLAAMAEAYSASSSPPKLLEKLLMEAFWGPKLAARAAAKSDANFGVPRPVTGSQPVLAAKPFVLQPVLWPRVTSLNAVGLAYRKGFKNPSEGLPAAMSRSLIKPMTLAKVGEEQDVPSTPPVWPPSTIWKSTPWVETSG